MTIIRLLRVACGFVLAVLCFACAATGQTETATISGLITDDTGAVMPGAEVKLQNIERGTTSSATTNKAGIYVFTSVHPGPYQLTVHKPGFRQVDLLNLIVNVQDHIEQNFRLQVGSVSESVTVHADDLHIDTEDASVSTVVDRQFAENLPMNGRSFQTLIELTPGVVLTQSNTSDNGQFSIDGQRAASNYWMVDGVSANIGVSALTPGNGFGGTLGSFSALGGTNSLVSVDALQEFRIQTSTYAPEFGRTPGGQISIVTRSGTSQFHGTVFDYLRNDIFDAGNWFNGYINNPPLPKSKERQNDFGGTFSGPISRKGTFFFFSYEGLRLRLPQTELTTVPDVAARQNASPGMQPYFNAFPLPSGTDNVATGIAQFNKSFSDPATLDAYSLRIDHKVGEKLNLFGRYNYSPSEIVQRGANAQALSVVSVVRITTQTATGGATWLISPTVMNDFRGNYSRTNASNYAFLDNFGGAVPVNPLPLPGGLTPQNASFSLEIFSLTLGPRLQAGQGAQNLQRQVNFVDNLSVQLGSHSLKFGVDFRRLSPLTAPASYNQGVNFSDVPSAETGTISLGFVSSSARTALLFRNLSAFAQDTWRIVPRLTLTYGVRWDVDYAPSSLEGPNIPALTGYNLTNFSNLTVASAGTPPFKTTYGNFAPRLGLAYQVSQSQSWLTVLRGGFGVFYDLVSSETGNAIGSGFPPFGMFNFNVTGPFPFAASEITPPIIPPANISGLAAFNPNLKLPYTLEWNAALEQALGKEQTVTVSYVGAVGRRLLQTSEILFPPTNANLLGVFVDNTASSNYNAVQLQFVRRLSHNLQALGSYTWSHSIDDGSAGSNAVLSNAGVPGNPNQNRGPSDFDIRNALSVGVTYDAPALKLNRFMTVLTRGWSTDNFITARSAAPVDISDQNFSFVPFNSGVLADIRPDLVPGQPLYLFGPQYPGGKAFNANAFTNPPTDPNTGLPLRQGNLPRNALRGFGLTQWDFAVHRDFPIRESLKLQFRAEMFNVLNHPNFGQPNGGFPFPPFGLSTQTLGASLNGSNLGGGAFSPLYQIGGPRSIQFALKLFF